MAAPILSLVIPVYNEAATLQALYERISAAAPRWAMAYEVVLVNDGSSDGSLEQMRTLAQQNPSWRVVNLSRNFGHQQAISAGLSVARGQAVVVMDGDLQDPPEAIANLLAEWRKGAQVVYAIRSQRPEGLPKQLGYLFFYRLMRQLSEIDMPLDSGDFCLMDRRVVDVLKRDMPEHHRFVRGLRAYVGFRQVGIAVPRGERVAGQPKYTYRKLVSLALNGLFGFSTLPLRFSTWLGLGTALLSVLAALFFIVHRITGFKILGHSPADTPGLTTLAVITFFMGGVILTSLGILGEYVGRIYAEVKRRPPFIIAEIIEGNPPPPEN